MDVMNRKSKMDDLKIKIKLLSKCCQLLVEYVNPLLEHKSLHAPCTRPGSGYVCVCVCVCTCM